MKLEIPIDLVKPASTSWYKCRSHKTNRVTHLLHGLPGGGNIVGQRDIELGLALRVPDDVVPSGANTLWGVDLEVDLFVSGQSHQISAGILTFQCMR